MGNVVANTFIFGRIAQLVEQWPFKPMVGGSNPSAPTEILKTPFREFLKYFAEGFERAEANSERRRAK
jgi:hypothetical protein